jgi:signal transduction histidine kinase
VRQTKNCSKIVKDLLNFSRSDKSVIANFNIDEAVQEVLGVIEHTFLLNQVVVHHEYNHEIDLIMRGDKEKIKQVLINLLNNAFDAVNVNGNIVVKTKLVKDKSKNIQNKIEISISDTGHGIERKNINKIFEPFYTTKAPDQGTGLGLSVTFGIIKEHNGTIKAFSPSISGKNKDKGTQFIIALPCNLNYI